VYSLALSYQHFKLVSSARPVWDRLTFYPLVAKVHVANGHLLSHGRLMSGTAKLLSVPTRKHHVGARGAQSVELRAADVTALVAALEAEDDRGVVEVIVTTTAAAPVAVVLGDLGAVKRGDGEGRESKGIVRGEDPTVTVDFGADVRNDGVLGVVVRRGLGNRDGEAGDLGVMHTQGVCTIGAHDTRAGSPILIFFIGDHAAGGSGTGAARDIGKAEVVRKRLDHDTVTTVGGVGSGGKEALAEAAEKAGDAAALLVGGRVSLRGAAMKDVGSPRGAVGAVHDLTIHDEFWGQGVTYLRSVCCSCKAVVVC
jgi:hypothetical protein